MARPKGLHGRLDDLSESVFDGRQMVEAMIAAEVKRREEFARQVLFLAAVLRSADGAARDVRRLAGGECETARSQIAAAA